MTISDKIFSYIDVAQDLTPEMIHEYTNSLIFIGDEQQIYHPLTGAYVGIGMSNFNEVKDQIQNTTNMLRHLDTHIHQNVVNSIFASYIYLCLPSFASFKFIGIILISSTIPFSFILP